MIRRIVPVLAVAALLGACSHNSNNYPEPGSPSMSRSDDARGEGRGEGRGNGARMEQMALRNISLSNDQQRQIDAITANYRSQMDQMRQSGNPDRSAMREMMEHQQRDIRNVLNSDQQAQYDRNIAEMRSRMQQNGDRRPNG